MSFLAIPDTDLEVDDFLTVGLMRQFRDNDDALSAGHALKYGTPIATTSGTAHDFTGIPAGTKLIVLSYSGVSFATAVPLLLQLGDSGGIEAADYATLASPSGSSFAVHTLSSDLDLIYGHAVLALLNASTNLWTIRSPAASGSKALSGTLDRIRISGGTFDAGSVNILYM